MGMNPLFVGFSKWFLTLMETDDTLGQQGAQGGDGGRGRGFAGTGWIAHGDGFSVGSKTRLLTGAVRHVSEEKNSKIFFSGSLYEPVGGRKSALYLTQGG